MAASLRSRTEDGSSVSVTRTSWKTADGVGLGKERTENL